MPTSLANTDNKSVWTPSKDKPRKEGRRMARRPAVNAEITRALLLESGHRCAVCGAGCPLQKAHIIPWHKSKQHRIEDLICLCASCHARADTEHWGEKALREYKKKPWIMRQGSNPQSV